MGYWSVAILFWQMSIDHIVNVLYKRWGLAKTRPRHPSLPFDSLPYPTRTICRRVRTYVRSVNLVTTKRKEVDHILWVWGSVPRSLRACGSPAINSVTPHNSAASRAVFLIPKISHIIRHCKFVLQGGCFFLKKLKRHVLFKLEQRTRRRKKLSLNQFFFTSWTITSVNAHGRTCKKTKVYIYLYISLYGNLFENGCIYIK